MQIVFVVLFIAVFIGMVVAKALGRRDEAGKKTEVCRVKGLPERCTMEGKL